MKAASGSTSWLPSTRTGIWSVWLGVIFIVAFVANIAINVNVIRPFGVEQPLITIYITFVISMLLCGLAGGVTGILALTRQHEHSPFVWISTLCGLFVLLLILNELMQGLQYMLGT